MSDAFTDSSSQSIFGRLGNAIKGVLFGIVLIPVAIILLLWNEGRTVKTAASLKEGAAVVVSVSADAVQPENENKLIHLTGEAVTTDTLSDPMFAVSANAIRLTRTADTFQWKEAKAIQYAKQFGRRFANADHLRPTPRPGRTSKSRRATSNIPRGIRILCL